MSGLTLSLIIPVYNEEEGIEGVIRDVIGYRKGLLEGTHEKGKRVEIEDFEIIFVDDGSTDGTSNILKKFAGIDGIRILTLKRNQGYGSAIKQGIGIAKGEVIGFMDGDGSLRAEALTPLLNAVQEGADIVCGNRRGDGSGAMPLLRWVGNRLFSMLLSYLSETPVKDPATGMRLFRRGVIPFLMKLPDGFDFTPAMSTFSLFEGFKVKEVDIPYYKRKGKSKLYALKDGMRFGRTIIKISYLYNPVKLFGNLGILSILLALLFSVSPLLHYFRFREVEEGAIYRLLTVLFLFVAGINLISFGIVSNLILFRIHGRTIKNRLLVRFLSMFKTDRLLILSGSLLILSSLILVHRAIYQYITTLHIYLHWSYFVLGGTLSLCGIQLITFGILLKILKGIESFRDVRR